MSENKLHTQLAERLKTENSHGKALAKKKTPDEVILNTSTTSCMIKTGRLKQLQKKD
jgi:hypothetical protein